MFTGIVQAIGRISSLKSTGEEARLRIDCAGLDLAHVKMGDSVAIQGVCLTATGVSGEQLEADVSAETLRCTTLGDLQAGDPVNLELALTPTTPLGGHLVTGHVDGLAELDERQSCGESVRMRVRVPDSLARYIATKGSVALDGVSLTVNAVDGAVFEVNLIPHTLDATTLGQRQPGDPMNLEVDLVARYLERLVLGEKAANPGEGVTRELLARHGFIDEP